MIIPVKQVGAVGLVVDQPFDTLPLNAWTAARNVRFRDGAAEKTPGHVEVYATPLNAPYFLLPYNNGATQFWIYPGLAKIGATDGASHADITRASGGDYNTDLNIGWTGTVLEGIPVLTNGVDLPQMWSPPTLATDLTTLVAWPALTTCRSMRSLKRFLVALDVTKSGVRYPFMVKWSHLAPIGGLPTSWDETDETLDAGEYTLPADGGFVVDAHSLRDTLVVYKEFETWLMQFVGGVEVFRFSRIFSSFGSFNRRCAIEFFSGRQLVFTGDDIVVHDSQQSQSVLDRKAKALIQSVIDTSNYQRSFVAVNQKAREVWVCFPEVGNTLPNKAIVWNWAEGTIGLKDLPHPSFIASGIVNPANPSEVWSGATGEWQTDAESWGERSFNPGQREMLMAVPGETKLHLLNSGNLDNGVAMVSQLERRGLGFPLKIDQPPDFTTMKLFKGIYPRISGSQGGTINISVGSQQVANGPVTWGNPRSFVIGTTRYLDFRVAGRMHALKFESTTDINWKLHDYDVDVSPIGRN